MISDGQSAIDSISIEAEGVVYSNWDDYQYTDQYTAPYPQWSFSSAPQYLNGKKSAPSALKTGTRVAVRCNGVPLCVGYVDERSLDTSSGGGLNIKISGRDILGPVDDACMDPQYQRWSATTTVADVLLAVLAPHGITQIVNAPDLDIAITTGKAKPRSTKTSITASVPSAGGLFTTSSGIYEAVAGRADLKAEKIDALKPKVGEGNKEFLDRLLKRFGLYLRAMADGSGVMVTVPRYDQTPLYKIYHTAQNSTVLKGSYTDRSYNQPSAVVCYAGKSGKTPSQRMTAIAINELASYLPSGAQTPHLQALLARYKHAIVAPIREPLRDAGRSRKYASTRTTPLFFEAQEAKNLTQALAAAKRELARLQSQAEELRYTVLGYTQGGIPWTTNTIADVTDDVLGVYGPWWIKERTFRKSTSGGTTTDLVLIRPYTMEF